MIPLTFLELYQLHQFSSEELACEAQVSTDVVDLMLQGIPVPRTSAQQVLKALSLQTRRYYTLHSVTVNTIENHQKGA